jgi:hypothetical protein
MSQQDYDTQDSRIKEEVVIIDENQETETSNTPEQEENSGEERKSSPWLIITTGKILTAGTLPYHRYFIAIAVMCFISIFLTFMSLNADREYRQRERYATILHERAVLKEEHRYSISSKSAITSRLKQHGIELIELSKDSRLIKK